MSPADGRLFDKWTRTLTMRSAKASGSGGAATSQSDSQNSTAKAKKDHPEAPDTVIGMQDERGAKGS